MTNDERMQRESNLITTIRKTLPEFAKACSDETDLVLLHQDSFAADYQEDEYRLLGMAIKYAGLRGKEVRVIGRNRSSLAKKIESSLHDQPSAGYAASAPTSQCGPSESTNCASIGRNPASLAYATRSASARSERLVG